MTSQHSKRPSPRRPARFRPGLEVLEGRDVPSTLTVTSPLDDGSSGTLRATIAAAASGDTIVFANSLSGQTITLNGNELLLNKNLSIQGPAGATQLAISANNLSRVFEVAVNTQVTLAGLTIRDGNSNGTIGGGGIKNAGATTVSGCTLSYNTADYGGGIYSFGTLTVSGCTLSYNKAYFGNGGGIAGGLNDSLTVTGSTLSHNSAAMNGGGLDDFGSNTKLDTTTLSYNSAGNDGGGIHNGDIMSLNGCTVTNNSAAQYGGGIYSENPLSITGGNISGNSANTAGGIWGQHGLKVTSATISNNVASFTAGGVYALGVTTTLTGCTITGNSAEIGGGIYNDGTAIIQTTNITNNSASIQGGGIFNDVNSTLTLYSSTVVSGNSAPDGPDIYNLGKIFKKKG
jgi:predicted outer membrane repeat protein